MKVIQFILATFLVIGCAKHGLEIESGSPATSSPFWTSDEGLSEPATSPRDTTSRNIINSTATKGGAEDIVATTGRNVGKYYLDKGCLEPHRANIKALEDACRLGDQGICSLLYFRNVSVGRGVNAVRVEPDRNKRSPHYIPVCGEFLDECVQFWANNKVPNPLQPDCVTSFNTCTEECKKHPEPHNIK